MLAAVSYDWGMNQERRRRRSASELPALLEQWSTSGETAARFAARIGVKPATLARWQKTVGSKPRVASALSREKKTSASASSVFARVQVVEPVTRTVGVIEVVMRDGLVVRLHGAVDADTLGTVLGCMARC
ncbi:MAG: hypothetical protein RLZZ450_6952 [Pseudomonadota bacterium]